MCTEGAGLYFYGYQNGQIKALMRLFHVSHFCEFCSHRRLSLPWSGVKQKNIQSHVICNLTTRGQKIIHVSFIQQGP